MKKIPPRVYRAVENDASLAGGYERIIGWARVEDYYLVVYDMKPMPSYHDEASVSIQRRWFVFDKTGRVHYSGVVSIRYDWR